MAGDNTRVRILTTAGEVFAEKSYEAATIREICEKAGVNLAAVNYYFRGKQALYAEALERAHSCDTQEEYLPADTPPLKLKYFVRQLLSHMLSMKDEPWESRLMMREIMNPSAAGKRVLRDHFRKGFDQLQQILDEILPREVAAHRRHQIGFSIMGQCSLYRGLGKIIPLVIDEEELRQHYGIDELAEHITQMSLAALGLTSPLAGPATEKPEPARTLREHPEFTQRASMALGKKT
jgi:TetR/AcrR family transcriptional regulator, regulator of cefoperazone and chloramphenicol sensitivity